MKIQRVILMFFTLLTINGQAQLTTINRENYTFFTLDGMAEHLGLKNQEIAFGYDKNEDTLVIVSLKEQKVMVMGHVINEYFFNSAKMYWDPYWGNDTIYIKSEMPFRASVRSFHFVWNKEAGSFFASEPENYDPSSEALEKADSLLALGDVRGAVNNYYGIMYPSAYINEAETGLRIMEKSHEIALKYFKDNNLDSAIAIMEVGLEYYPNMNYLTAKSKEEFETNKKEFAYNMIWGENKEKLWLGDYGLFLYRNKKYEKSIEINKYINMILPELAGPYLQLGDSYFDTGNKKMAKETYQKYVDLKKSQKKEKEIPKRVKERIR